MGLAPDALVAALNALSPDLVLLLDLALCLGAVLLMLRLFGPAGLFAFIVVATVGANIQVLKVTQFSFHAHPVALGTVLFSMTYLCVDMLSEFYGRAAARRGIMLGFAAMVLMNLFMLTGLGYQPLDPATVGPDLAWAAANHDAMAALFIPQSAIVIASLSAYLVSEFADAAIFQRLRRATDGRHLWLRNTASTMVAALIDNTVFSLLAWVVLAPDPVDFDTLLFTFILGTYLFRVGIALLQTPAMYAAAWLIRGRQPVYA